MEISNLALGFAYLFTLSLAKNLSFIDEKKNLKKTKQIYYVSIKTKKKKKKKND